MVRKRKDLAFNWIFILFAAFILACGTTHIIDVWTVWTPNYGLEGVVKLFTGLISASTAVILWLLIPKALAIPTASDLEAVNLSLRREIDQKNAAKQVELQIEQRFKALVAGVKDYVIIMLDPTGNVTTWNPGAERILGYSEPEIIGRHFSSFYSPEAAAADYPANELRIAAQVGRYEEESLRVRKNGERFWATVVITG